MAAVRDNAWVGIDVGKTHHWVCAVDADGKTLLSVKVANDEAGIVSLIAAVTDGRTFDDTQILLFTLEHGRVRHVDQFIGDPTAVTAFWA